MAETGQTVIRIVCRSDGAATPVDGQFVVEYDPALTWHGGDRSYKLVTSPDIARARGFADAGAAHECWRQVCPTVPRREDGRPNRPLTAYSVELYEVPK